MVFMHLIIVAGALQSPWSMTLIWNEPRSSALMTLSSSDDGVRNEARKIDREIGRWRDGESRRRARDQRPYLYREAGGGFRREGSTARVQTRGFKQK
jgi:hypothetical protein